MLVNLSPVDQVTLLEAGADYAARQAIDTLLGRMYRSTEPLLRWAARLLRTGALPAQEVSLKCSHPDPIAQTPWSASLELLTHYGYQHK